jgi:hypothetical protein
MDYFDYIAETARPCAVVAHRGVWNAAPENSMLAIERAIEAGHDVVEIDVRRTADGGFCLCHDDTFERMAGVDLKPEEISIDDALKLTLRQRDGGIPERVSDQKVPNLRDVFDLTRDRIFVHLDCKRREIIPDVIECARQMGVDRQVDFWGELKSEDDLRWVSQAVLPAQVPFMAKTRLTAANATEQLELVFRLKPFMCEIYFDQLEDVAAISDRFREAGIALWVNTLDDISCAGFTDTAARSDPKSIWGRLIEAGISAIQTDEMNLLRTLVGPRSESRPV